MKIATDKIQYSQQLLTDAWQNKRKEILQRDNHTCRNCRSQEKLEVHHRQYHVDSNSGRLREPWDYNNKYLVTLCSRCHKLGHQLYQVSTFKN